MSFGATVIKKEIFDKYHLNVQLIHAEDSVFLTELVMSKEKYGIIKDTIFYYRKRKERTSSAQTRNHDRRWYFDTPEKGYLRLIDESIKKYGKTIPYVQYYLAYEMDPRLNMSISPDLTS